jgi:hypothetical protein
MPSVINVAAADPAASWRGMFPPPHKAGSSKQIPPKVDAHAIYPRCKQRDITINIIIAVESLKGDLLID